MPAREIREQTPKPPRTVPLRPLLIGAGVIAVVAALWFAVWGGDGDSSSTLTDPDASPSDIIEAWGEVACDGEAVVEIEPDLPSAVAAAYCDLGSSGSTAERAYLTVYTSSAAVATRIAEGDCGSQFRKVRGPVWFATSAVSEVTTALQEAGGELVC